LLDDISRFIRYLFAGKIEKSKNWGGSSECFSSDGTNITPNWGDALFTIDGNSYIKISGFRIINSLSPHNSGGIVLKKGL